jgi:hypothetical protein
VRREVEATADAESAPAEPAPAVQPADPPTGGTPGPTGREPATTLLLAAFTLIAILLTYPQLSRMRTYIAGDSGDALLEMWVVRRVEIGLPHGWHALWNPPIFFPAHTTLAYSDTLFPIALLHWPLRTVVGDVLAYNLIYLASWVLASWCVYRLARRVVTHWGAAFVAGLVYTYSAIRLVHQSHFQLVVGGAIVPLVLLLLLRCLDAPSVGRGALVGLALASLALTASYYGAMMGVFVAIVAAGWMFAHRPGGLRPFVVALGAAAIVAVVLIAPFGVQYLRLQQHPEFRRGFSSVNAAHVGDFLATGPRSRVLAHVPVISSHSGTNGRSIENRLFPGFVGLAFGAAGAIVVAGEIRRRGWRTGRGRELLLVVLAGIAGLVLAFGDWFRVAGHRIFLPFVVFRHFVPGFAGIRAVSRLALAFELALALLAAVGLEFALRRAPRRTGVALVVVLVAVVIAEAALPLTFVRVPTTADDGGISAALRARPTGVVAELPVESSARGVTWPFVESPRQLVALHDHDPRLNGYSGFEPKDFDAVASGVNAFPDQDAVATLRGLGVRYVVLRTALVGTLNPSVLLSQIDRDGQGRYTPATAERMVQGIPPGVAAHVDHLAGGYLIELAR